MAKLESHHQPIKSGAMGGAGVLPEQGDCMNRIGGSRVLSVRPSGAPIFAFALFPGLHCASPRANFDRSLRDEGRYRASRGDKCGGRGWISIHAIAPASGNRESRSGDCL